MAAGASAVAVAGGGTGATPTFGAGLAPPPESKSMNSLRPSWHTMATTRMPRPVASRSSRIRSTESSFAPGTSSPMP